MLFRSAYISAKDTSFSVNESMGDNDGMPENTGYTSAGTEETSKDAEGSEDPGKSETDRADVTGPEAGEVAVPVSEETSGTAVATGTEKAQNSVFTLTSRADIYYAGESKGRQKGPDHLKTSEDDTSGSTYTYTWNLGEYSAELDFLYSDNQEQASLSKYHYTAV